MAVHYYRVLKQKETRIRLGFQLNMRKHDEFFYVELHGVYHSSNKSRKLELI